MDLQFMLLLLIIIFLLRGPFPEEIKMKSKSTSKMEWVYALVFTEKRFCPNWILRNTPLGCILMSNDDGPQTAPIRHPRGNGSLEKP
jgi:hypothetical protein